MAARLEAEMPGWLKDIHAQAEALRRAAQRNAGQAAAIARVWEALKRGYWKRKSQATRKRPDPHPAIAGDASCGHHRSPKSALVCSTAAF